MLQRDNEKQNDYKDVQNNHKEIENSNNIKYKGTKNNYNKKVKRP